MQEECGMNVKKYILYYAFGKSAISLSLKTDIHIYEKAITIFFDFYCM